MIPHVGRVFYTPAFYEDFTEKWRRADDKRWGTPRIDVDEWRCYVPEGITVKGLSAVRLSELHLAVFEIPKGQSFEKLCTSFHQYRQTSDQGAGRQTSDGGDGTGDR